MLCQGSFPPPHFRACSSVSQVGRSRKLHWHPRQGGWATPCMGCSTCSCYDKYAACFNNQDFMFTVTNSVLYFKKAMLMKHNINLISFSIQAQEKKKSLDCLEKAWNWYQSWKFRFTLSGQKENLYCPTSHVIICSCTWSPTEIITAPDFTHYFWTSDQKLR